MKKKLSFMLAVVMLVANFAISAFAADTKTTFTDVTSKTQYAEAILTLVKLGVINGYDENGVKTFKPEGGITRAEFAAIITRAMGIAGNVGGASPFTDVAADHWAVKNIIAATDRGITNGMGDGTFHPDENVTYEQAIKMIVCALNYTTIAEIGGGWPDGYFNQGTTLGLTKGVSTGTLRTAPAPRGVVAQLVFNALDIKVADAKNSVATDKTFLNQFLNMEMVTGKIVGVEEDVTAECDYTLSRDEMAVLVKGDEIISIDFENYAEKDTIINYLGQEALVFYKIAATGGMNELVILDSEVTENETVEIFSEFIRAYSAGKVDYYNESGKRDSIEFDVDDVTVYYNKKAVTMGITSKLGKWLDPSNDSFIYGSVTLTDSGSDGTIDMVEIMDYEYMVALRIPSSSDYTVTNKMKFKNKENSERILDEVTLNPDKKSYSFTIKDQNGNSMQTTSIKANSVVMVAASENEDMFTVLVSSETVDGTARSYSEEDGTIQINGKEYNITNDCVEYLKEQGNDIEGTLKGKFYLDAFGNIAYATLNVDTDSTTLVYLITAIYDEDTEESSLRVFVPGSGYKTYQMADKVRVNNGNQIVAEDAIEILRDNSDDFKDTDDYNLKKASNANQLIKIELENNEVKEIITIDSSKKGTTNETGALLLYNSKPQKYKYNANTFTGEDDKFFVNSSTVFIYVPTDRTDTKGYQKTTTGFFDKTLEYKLDPINVSDSKMAQIVLIYGTTTGVTIGGATPMSVLASRPKDDASGDDVVKMFEYYTNSNSLKEILVDEDEDVDSMKAGDIFQYATSNEGAAADVNIRIKYSDIAGVLNDDDSEYDWTNKKFKYETPYKRQDGTDLPYSTAIMYNVKSVEDDGIIVTREGFVDGELPDDVDTVLVQINSSTKFLKMNEDGNEILSVDEESEVELTYEHLIEADYEGDKCSKIAVITHNGDYAKVIVIYE